MVKFSLKALLVGMALVGLGMSLVVYPRISRMESSAGRKGDADILVNKYFSGDRLLLVLVVEDRPAGHRVRWTQATRALRINGSYIRMERFRPKLYYINDTDGDLRRLSCDHETIQDALSMHPLKFWEEHCSPPLAQPSG